MYQYHSIFTDNIIMSLSQSKWKVHSLFNKVINLSNHNTPHLLTITDVSHPLLPYGIHLMPHDFEQLKRQLKMDDILQLTPYYLQYKQLQINVSKQNYDSQLTMSQVVQSHNIALLIHYLSQLSIKNGFGQTFKQSLSDRQHLIKQLVLQEDKVTILNRLIGKGIGLTPTGDDMIVGYNLAASCLQQPLLHPNISQTTDISRHYLYCSRHQRFHGLLLQLVKLLSQSQLSLATLKPCIDAILSFGHTSGCDTLTGFILAVFYMKGVF